MSFWKRLFGSPDATKEAVKAVRDGLDSIWYTDEEKAGDAMADRSEARRVLLEWVKNSQGQNLSRRLLAVVITFAWLGFKMIGVVLSVAGMWITDTADGITASKLESSAGMINEFSGDMTPAVMLILGFYFAAPHMGRIAEAALTRFGERNQPASKPGPHNTDS